MKLKLFKLSSLLIISAVLFAACASAPQKGNIIVSGSNKPVGNPPEWAGKTWTQGNSYYFSGISDFSSSLADARQRAYSDALTKAAEYIGVSVNNMTSSFLSNDSSSLNSMTNMSVEETKLAQGIIKDFQYTQNKDKFVGYILLEYNKQDLDKEKQRKKDLEKQKQDRIAARQNTVITVYADKNLDSLAPSIKQAFNKLGYKIGNNGTALNANIADETFEPVRNNMIMCVLKVEVELKGAVQTFEGFGYGKTNAEAAQKARARLAEVVNEEIDVNIF